MNGTVVEDTFQKLKCSFEEPECHRYDYVFTDNGNGKQLI